MIVVLETIIMRRVRESENLLHLPSLSYDKKKWDVQFSFAEQRSLLRINSKSSCLKNVRVSVQMESNHGEEVKFFDGIYDATKQTIVRLDALHIEEHTVVIYIDETDEQPSTRKLFQIRPKELMVEDKILSKELLALHSPVFEKLFYSDFLESKQDVIKLSEEYLENFLLLRDAIEQRKFQPQTVEQSCVLFDRTHFYQIDGLKESCERFIVKAELSHDQKALFSIMQLAEKFKDEQFFEKLAASFLSADEVVETTSKMLIIISKETVFKLLSMMTKFVPSPPLTGRQCSRMRTNKSEVTRSATVDECQGWKIGDRCIWNEGPDSNCACICFIGVLKGHASVYAGLNFDESVGQGTGTYEGEVLFTAPNGHAGFVLLWTLRCE